MKQATVLAIGEKKNAGGIRCSSGRGFLRYRSPEPGTAAGVARLGTLPCCSISPEISAEQVADFLQHRLLKLKPGHTAGADPLPDELTRYPAALAGRGGTLVSISGDATATEARC